MSLKLQCLFYLTVAILFSLGGLVGFFLLFRRNFNVYWFILAPVILALYQAPAAWFFKLYKRARLRLHETGHTEP